MLSFFKQYVFQQIFSMKKILILNQTLQIHKKECQSVKNEDNEFICKCFSLKTNKGSDWKELSLQCNPMS